VVLSIRFCVLFSKGVIWLLLATVAGVVPTVSLASFFVHISLLFSFDVQVFACLDLNGTFCFLLSRNEKY
jgi:hypothetical protein